MMVYVLMTWLLAYAMNAAYAVILIVVIAVVRMGMN